MCSTSFWCIILVTSSYGKSYWCFLYVNFYCVGAGITTFVSNSDGLDPYIFPSKEGKDAVYERERDGEVFNSRQNRRFSFIDNMNEYFSLVVPQIVV